MSFYFHAEVSLVGFRVFVELMMVRSLLLGVIESKRPELWPGFFEVDLAPYILKLLCRDDGGYCGELMKSTDCIPCTVLFWFTSALPLLTAMLTYWRRNGPGLE